MKIVSFKESIFCSILTILYLVSAGISSAKIGTGNFAGAWLFDEGAGDRAKDLSGKSGDGVLWNSPKWVQGKTGSAIDFDGENDYVEMSLPEILNNIPKNDFSISFWINVQDISGSGDVWTRVLEARYDNTNYIQFVIQINNGELGVNIMVDGAETTSIVNSPIKADTWYYTTATWEAAQKSLKFYLNGAIQSGKGTTPASPGTLKALNIGRRTDGSDKTYFDGIIDEFAILNIALTEDDIAGLMNEGLKTFAAVSSLDKLPAVWGKIKGE